MEELEDLARKIWKKVLMPIRPQCGKGARGLPPRLPPNYLSSQCIHRAPRCHW